MKLRIATYNVASCHSHLEYTLENRRCPFVIEDTVSAIKSLDADICGLNELDFKNGRTNYVDQLSEIKTAQKINLNAISMAKFFQKFSTLQLSLSTGKI